MSTEELNKNTKNLLKGILKKYLEKEELKKSITELIQREFELAPMKTRIPSNEMYTFFADTLRLTSSKPLLKTIKASLQEQGVRHGKIEGYWYFHGIRKRTPAETSPVAPVE